MDQLSLFDAPAMCSVGGCLRLVHQKTLQLCSPHYKRHWRHGDPLAGGAPRLGAKAGKPVVDLDDGTRVCRDCQQAKPLDEFPRDKGGTRGRRAACKLCHTAGVTVWYVANRDEHLARIRTRRQQDGDRARELDRKRYERDKPKRIALVTEAVHRRRALMQQVAYEPGITVKALRKKHGDECCYCDVTMSFERGNGRTYVPTKATIEHIVAISKGGGHTWANTALACWQCNVRKNAKSLDEWLASSPRTAQVVRVF